MAMKKRGKGMPKKIIKNTRTNRKGLIVLGVIVLAIPVTLLLLSQPQDNRQEAATVRSDLYITTDPNETLNVSISQKNGNAMENADPGEGNNTKTDKPRRTKQKDDSDNGGSGDCQTEDTTEKTDHGTNRNININCDGGDQTIDKSGSDGNRNVQRTGGKQDSTSKTRKSDRRTKDSKSSRESLLQRILDRFRGIRR